MTTGGAEVSADLSDLRDLQLQFDAAQERVGRRVAQALRKTGFDIVNDAQQLLIAQDAVDTGNLLNSVGVTFYGDGRSSTMLAEAGPTAEYGGFIENGTSRMAPRPYMGPAFDRRAPLFEAAVAQVAGDIL